MFFYRINLNYLMKLQNTAATAIVVLRIEQPHLVFLL